VSKEIKTNVVEMAGGGDSAAVPLLSSVRLCHPQISVDVFKSKPNRVCGLGVFVVQRRSAYIVHSARTAAGAQLSTYRHYRELDKLTV